MEESEQVLPLLTKAKDLTNPTSASSSSSSCETREETEDLCLPISSNEEEEEENSPIREVALTVPTTDDPSLPVLTFRMWVLGTLSCILLSFLNQFFWYRREPLTISAISAQIAVVPLGRLMAAKISDRVFLQGSKWEFTLNPGPFNVKEHVLITIFANAGAGSVYAIHVVTVVKAFYMKNITFFVSFIVIVTTQVLGFGWAGIFRKYLVEPAAMWWPANLVQVSLFRSSATTGFGAPTSSSTVTQFSSRFSRACCPLFLCNLLNPNPNREFPFGGSSNFDENSQRIGEVWIGCLHLLVALFLQFLGS